MKQLRSFEAFFKRQDNFSQPYKINYKGKGGKKTLTGAMITQGINIYLLYLAIPLIISVLSFKNPSISQHSILSPRDETTDYNFGDMYGSLVYGFFNPKDFAFVKPDPKYGELTYEVISHDWTTQVNNIIVDIDTEPISKENEPKYFLDGIGSAIKSWEGSNIASDPSQIKVRATLEHSDHKILRIAFNKCKPETAPEGVTCATDTELQSEFLDHNYLQIASNRNYVDYETVDGRLEPIEYQFEAFRSEHLNVNNPTYERYRITEHRATLKDSLWEASVEPKKFSYLNIYPSSLRDTAEVFAEHPDTVFTCVFDLDMEIKIESRSVKSLPVLVAAIVGLKIFFYRIIDQVFPLIQEKSKVTELIHNLFNVKAHELENSDSDKSASQKQGNAGEFPLKNYVRNFARFKFSFWESIKYVSVRAHPIYFGFCSIKNRRQKRMSKLVDEGYDQLNKALDIRTIVRYQRAVKTLLRLLLSKPSRKLISLQRSLRVIELPEDDGQAATQLMQDCSSSSSAPNFSDAEGTQNFLLKLAEEINEKDEYAVRLKRGVFRRDGLTNDNPEPLTARQVVQDLHQNSVKGPDDVRENDSRLSLRQENLVMQDISRTSMEVPVSNQPKNVGRNKPK